MKVNELFESKDAFFDLVKAYGLTANKAGTKINSFGFTDAIDSAFKAAGYTLHYNQKTDVFDVKSIAKQSSDAVKQAQNDAFARADVSGRKVGFRPKRKSGL